VLVGTCCNDGQGSVHYGWVHVVMMDNVVMTGRAMFIVGGYML